VRPSSCNPVFLAADFISRVGARVRQGLSLCKAKCVVGHDAEMPVMRRRSLLRSCKGFLCVDAVASSTAMLQRQIGQLNHSV